MNRKMFAYILIAAGAIPVLVKIVLQIMGRIGEPITFTSEYWYNFYIEYGTGIVLGAFFFGLLLMVIGFMMLKKEKMKALETREDDHLNAGEKIVYKQSGNSSIITITNQRVRYFGFYTKDLRRSVDNLPESDMEDYRIGDIKIAKVVTNADLMNAWINGKSKWGIQLEFKNGDLVNIPAKDQEILAEQINKVLTQSV